jgi:restriction system protein
MPIVAVKCTECGAKLSMDATQELIRCDYCDTPYIPEKQVMDGMKFCKFCGEKIHNEAVICNKCGRQVENVYNNQPAVPNPTFNNMVNVNVAPQYYANPIMPGKQMDKWVAFFLCLFLGFFGAHKFYEGRVGLGLLYLFTAGLFMFGWFIDLIIILSKPNPYYIR